jgi:hypothetical protein
MAPCLRSRGCGMRIVPLAAILLALAGCGESVKGRAGLVPVTGKVTLDGKPLTTGTVSFITSDGSEAFTGQIDASGNYKLAASPTDPGALPGEYKVIVMATESKTMTAEDSKAMEAKAKAAQGGTGDAATTAPKSLVPEKYTKVATSGLTRTVKAGSNSIDLELTSS